MSGALEMDWQLRAIGRIVKPGEEMSYQWGAALSSQVKRMVDRGPKRQDNLERVFMFICIIQFMKIFNYRGEKAR